MQEVLSIEDTKLLLGYCRAGRLYEIEKWIVSQKSLRTHPSAKRTPTVIDAKQFPFLGRPAVGSQRKSISIIRDNGPVQRVPPCECDRPVFSKAGPEMPPPVEGTRVPIYEWGPAASE